ncbi:putative GTPase activating protein (GAP) [Tieghemostelium lacteum]|uniref:Putative GTPase activating protein (GAP) n=1 Tax=Tieghemostelium lacteum TaxID=361077 RepID=A0A151ZGN3_TIELA|nr:putative GTPase activating protein (GAP) [Tieghemostelium lacteum]|eukprot:KYQ93069.1 putative GTPase activating protein (GAP) [Tieghemostelium lacteum]
MNNQTSLELGTNEISDKQEEQEQQEQKILNDFENKASLSKSAPSINNDNHDHQNGAENEHLQQQQQQHSKSLVTSPTIVQSPPSILLNSNEITLGSFNSSMVTDHHTLGQSTLVGGMSPARVGSIFDHFIVVGLPSTIELSCTTHDEKQTHKAQVIYKYPEDDQLPNDMIEQFCFPTGVTSRSSQRSLSSSSINQVAFCNLTHLLSPQSSFIFLITTQSILYYGICIVKDEEVLTLPNFIDPNSALNQPREGYATVGEKKRGLNREQYDFIAPRVYCLITRFPLFQLHFQMLHAILESERMLMLFSMSKSIDPGLTTRAIDILNLYHGINMDSIKDRIQFKIPSHDYKTDFHCPIGSEDRLIADWSIYTAFQVLSIENILSLFSWVLLERQVLVVSKYLGNVSSVLFSLISLLKPFTWQCCFIPVLPETLLESLDAPFPFIIGYSEIPEYILNTKRDYLIVDIDQKKLLYPSTVPDTYLPGNKKLLNTLTAHKKECQDLQNQIPIDHLKHRFTQNILSTFREYQTWLVDQICYGIITCINNLYILEQQQQPPPSPHHQHQPQQTTTTTTTTTTDINITLPSHDLDQLDMDDLTITPSQNTSPTTQSLLQSNNNNNNSNNNNNINQIDPLKSIELLNKQSIHFLENAKNIQSIVECLPDKYQDYFKQFFSTQMFTVNAVKLMLSIQERHKTSISLIEKLESLIQMEEKSKEVLMEYQRIAKKENNKANVDINILKKQLKDSEGVINELRESKKKLEMETLATSPSKGNSTLTSFLGLSSISELRKKKLEFGHRRSRSVTDQVEKNILKKSLKPPSLSFFSNSGNSQHSSMTDLTKSTSNLNASTNGIQLNASSNGLSTSVNGTSNFLSSKPNSPTSLSNNSGSILDIMEKVDQQLQQVSSSSLPNTPSSISPMKTPRSGTISPTNE